MISKEPALNSKFENAERELGAFVQAVSRLHGSALERTAADQWMETLTNTPCNGAEPSAFFRRVSVLAAARLATDISAYVEDCSRFEYSEPCPC